MKLKSWRVPVLRVAQPALARLDYKWRVLAVVSLANFASTLDAGIVSLSLPDMREALDVSTADALWIVTAYLLTSLGLLLVVGRLSDALGRKQWFIAGLVLFHLGMGLVAAGQDLAQVIGYRVLSAVGGAMFLSSGVALVTAAFPPTERGRAMGFMGIMISAGLAVGPLTVGPVLDHLGWRAAFYLRLPLGIACVALALPWLRESRDGAPLRFDTLGAATVFAGLVSIVLATGRAAAWGVTSPAFIGLLGFGSAMLATFVWAERRARQPLFDLGLFRDRVYAVALASGFVYYMAVAGPYYLLPFYLAQGHGYSSTVSGLLLALSPAAMMLLSPPSGVLADRYGSRLPVMAGIVLLVGSYIWLSTFGQVTATALVAAVMMLYGVAGGMVEPPNNSAIMGAARPERLSVASASLGVGRQMGLSMGVALASAVFSARQEHYAASHAETAALVMGFQDAVMVSVGLAALTGFLAFFRGRG